MQNHVVFDFKVNRMMTEQIDFLIQRNRVQLVLHFFNRHRIRRITEQPQQHAFVRTMPNARQAK